MSYLIENNCEKRKKTQIYLSLQLLLAGSMKQIEMHCGCEHDRLLNGFLCT